MSYSRRGTIDCNNPSHSECKVEASLSIIGGKWKMKIYERLRHGAPLRFNEIKSLLDPVSDKTLSAQLREMEQDNILIRKVYPVIPPKVEYRLTDLGKSLEDLFRSLENWGQLYMSQKTNP